MFKVGDFVCMKPAPNFVDTERGIVEQVTDPNELNEQWVFVYWEIHGRGNIPWRIQNLLLV